jgi:putative transposase
MKGKKQEQEKESMLPDVTSKEFLQQFKTAKDLESYMAQMYRNALQAMLAGEMDEHLGHSKYERTSTEKENYRNGSSSKTVKTELGNIEIETPRDRNGTFEPIIVPKRQTVMDNIEEAVIALYSKGMTTRDVEEQVERIYGIRISDTDVSRITNRLLDVLTQWQNRPLESVYAVVWFDGIRFKIRDAHKMVVKTVYLAVGLNLEGRKEPLGLWLSETESAGYWMVVLDELKARGVTDIIISVTDNLTGFSEAIKAVYPKCQTQICIVHQIRNSFKYITYKDRKEFTDDMKKIYTAPTKLMAEHELDKLEDKWFKKYPTVVRSWRNNWENLSVFFDFPSDIRKIIYTTNTIENLNRVIRKFTKNRLMFPNDNAVKKAVFLALQHITRTWNKQTVINWLIIFNQLQIMYPERILIKI